MSKLHRLRTADPELTTYTTLGYVEDMDGTKMFRQGSASGPVSPMFIDLGVAEEGQTLAYHFNHVKREFMPQGAVWLCKIVRINRKSVTVVDTMGRQARLEL